MTMDLIAAGSIYFRSYNIYGKEDHLGSDPTSRMSLATAWSPSDERAASGKMSALSLSSRLPFSNPVFFGLGLLYNDWLLSFPVPLKTV